MLNEKGALLLKQVIQEKYIVFTQKLLVPELSKIPKFVIVAPAEIDENKFDGYKGATEKSKQFNKVFEKIANDNNCLFVSNKILQCGDDGIHLTTQSHKQLANILAELIK